jgi:hypothetical protein
VNPDLAPRKVSYRQPPVSKNTSKASSEQRARFQKPSFHEIALVGSCSKEDH